MNRRPTQFGVRENTASSRQHASRLASGSLPSISEALPWALQHRYRSQALTSRAEDVDGSATAMPLEAATGGGRRDGSQLLTVREVAEFLQVPVSWVYEQTRRRGADRIPGFRLGKYWRFSVDDVTAWLAAKRKKDYHHAYQSQ